MSNYKYIVVGKLGSTHGVRGWLKVQAYTSHGANIFDYQPWCLQKSPADDWRAVEIEDRRVQHNNLLVKLKDIDTPEQARELTGMLIGIDRAQLPELKENEYYWSDLVGMTVINQNSETLGKVIYLMETGSNDVLVVKGENEHAIPWLMDSVITHIDKERQVIYVNWELV